MLERKNPEKVNKSTNVERSEHFKQMVQESEKVWKEKR